MLTCAAVPGPLVQVRRRRGLTGAGSESDALVYFMSSFDYRKSQVRLCSSTTLYQKMRSSVHWAPSGD